MVIAISLLALPAICIVLIISNHGWLGLTCSIMLMAYAAALITLLLLEDNRTIAGNAGLISVSILGVVALIVSLRRGFLLIEGRRRRKTGFDSLLSDYGR